jgi:hypothetical protein
MNVLLSTAPTTIPGLPSIPTIPGSSGFQIAPNSSAVYSSGGTLGLGPFVGVLLVVLAIAVMLAVVGIFIIVVVANRADPDPSGRRPQSVYFFAVSFVTILTAVIASSVIVIALTLLIGSHPTPIADSIARVVVLGGLITLVSLALLITHLRQGLILAREGGDATNPSRRVGQTYVSVVSFVMVIILLVVIVLSTYLVFALIGPGVFGSFGGRSHLVRYLIDAVYIGVVAGVVLGTHRNLLTPGLHLFERRTATGSPPPSPMGSDPPFRPSL